jgi:predicted aspartyl protease
MCLAASSAAAERHCQLQSFGEIDATIVKGAIIAQANVDGHSAPMIIDTGSFGTMLFEASAKHLGLSLRDTGMTAYGVGGSTRVYSARVKEFGVAGLSERNADLAVTGRELSGAVGLIGALFLMQTDVEFDLPHGKIRFFKPVDCQGDEVVYWGQAYAVAPMTPVPNNEVIVRVEVNGQPIVAELDSGTSLSTMTFQGAQKAGVGRDDPALQAAGHAKGLGSSDVRTFVERFASFSFGDETIRNAELRVADLYAKDKEREIGNLIATPVSDEPQMLLGADFLHAHRVFIAREQHKVYVSYEGGPVFYPVQPPSQAAQTR